MYIEYVIGFDHIYAAENGVLNEILLPSQYFLRWQYVFNYIISQQRQCVLI